MSLLGNNPCQDSSEIKELSSGNRTINYTSSTYKCDLTDSEIGDDWSKWYKITGKAGNALQVHPPLRERCGGQAQAYLTENHPAPSDGVVNRKVCVQNPSNLCNSRKSPIQVVNCGSFYLYRLQRLKNDCDPNWRYCTNGKDDVEPPCQGGVFESLTLSLNDAPKGGFQLDKQASTP
ncbi:unnamed protein product [Porites lobata]|uniref:UMOD/GP2/OIT3-like D8C domain-containing protein n=1 Tax=Porites lobata TaxID=104759 RepID=A0ABN8Q762_9CNID|nr:unnamed protein product [Porites lobata]